MNSFVLFCIAMVLVSSLVAYLGDLLGRNIGKRRIKLFGLRPKATAMLITSLTGGLITLLTIVTIFTFFKDIRQAVMQIDVWKAEIAKTQQARDDAHQAEVEAEASIEDARKRLAAANDQFKTLEGQLNTTQSQLDDSQKKLAELGPELASKTAEGERLRGEIATSQSRLTEIKDKLAREQREIDANATLITQQETQNQRLRDEGARLQAVVTQYKQGDIAIPEGARLSGDYVDPSGSEADLLAKLRQLRAGAEQAVRGKVTLAPTQLSDYEHAVRSIQGGPAKEAIVMLVAAENGLVGGTMQTRFEIEPSLVVFKAGDVILRQQLKTALPDATAAGNFTHDTLLPALKSAAVRGGKGIVPELDGYVGGIDSFSIRNLVQDLMGATVPAEIVITATKDVKRLDPLSSGENFDWEIRSD